MQIKSVAITLVLIALSKPALGQAAIPPLTSVVKRGDYVAIHGSADVKGRVREVSDSSILLVGTPIISMTNVTYLELRKRKTPNLGPGIVIGTAIGAAVTYVVAHVADWQVSPAKKIIGKVLIISGISGFFGGLIGAAVHPVDSWETVWTK